MSDIVTKWKKYLLKEQTSTIIPSIATNTATTNTADPTMAAAAAAKQKQELEKMLKAKEAELAAKLKEKSTLLPDKIKQLQDEINNLKNSLQQESKGIGFGGGKQEGSLGVPVSVQQEELTEEELEEACGQHEGLEEGGKSCQLELEYNELEEEAACGKCKSCMSESLISEAKYKGRKVTLNKPMRGDVKKFKVFVRDPSTGNIKKVNFGDKKMRIKKSNPKRRKSFRARHRCSNPGPKTKARYWACRSW